MNKSLLGQFIERDKRPFQSLVEQIKTGDSWSNQYQPRPRSSLKDTEAAITVNGVTVVWSNLCRNSINGRRSSSYI